MPRTASPERSQRRDRACWKGVGRLVTLLAGRCGPLSLLWLFTGEAVLRGIALYLPPLCSVGFQLRSATGSASKLGTRMWAGGGRRNRSKSILWNCLLQKIKIIMRVVLQILRDILMVNHFCGL